MVRFDKNTGFNLLLCGYRLTLLEASADLISQHWASKRGAVGKWKENGKLDSIEEPMSMKFVRMP